MSIQSSSPSSNFPPTNSKESILIVDDTPDNLRLLSTMLNDRGYRVRQALNGQTALMTIQKAPPDLILLDIMMPEMNGYEVCRQLKADGRTREIPVIFISALDEMLDKVKAFNLGAVDYISKPFQREEVLARIENQLKIWTLSKKLQAQNAQLRDSQAREQARATELERTLDELKRTQAQLIHSEKMSSLAHTIAGVAHEINNPVNFIAGNLSFARHYFQDLLRLLEVYQKTYPEQRPRIQKIIAEIDLDYLVEDWQKLMASMQVGVDRIERIVRSLQVFSGLNESALKTIDLNEHLQNTLLLLEHRLRKRSNGNIRTIEEYAALPKVSCYASQLNQVFMHLLVNAIDSLESRFAKEVLEPAMAEKGQGNGEKCPTQHPQIHIRTEQIDKDWVAIHIADNGFGMSDEVLHRIFDPFFTTKPVGKGTGLGLTICYQIVVEQHQGQLRCLSTLGEGTEFIIELPITQ